MPKIKIGVIFGGMSTEHGVSLVSGTSIIKNLDNKKYDIYPIYIDKLGKWYKCLDISKQYKVTDEIDNIEIIDNIFSYLNNLDVLFPVLHGLYGEDGTIQGLFELLKKPYVGCRVLASSIAMDKVYTKIIFDKANIKQAKYEYIRKYNNKYIYIDKEFNENIYTLYDICKKINKNLKFPMFVKPSNSGSSVGVNKANNIKELEEYIEYASKYDNKILIEENIIGKEIECSVLGNEEVIASCLGEIKSAESYYTFDSKYNNSNSKVIIPANINKELEIKTKEIAIKAFKAIDGKGLARVDFFINEEKNEIYINEINTMPGFTNISMYPKLWEQSGINYTSLLDKLINLALDYNNKK